MHIVQCLRSRRPRVSKQEWRGTMIPPTTTVQGPHIHFDIRSPSHYIHEIEKIFLVPEKAFSRLVFSTPSPEPLRPVPLPIPFPFSVPTYPHSCFPKILFHSIAPAKYSISIPSSPAFYSNHCTPNRSLPSSSKSTQVRVKEAGPVYMALAPPAPAPCQSDENRGLK